MKVAVNMSLGRFLIVSIIPLGIGAVAMPAQAQLTMPGAPAGTGNIAMGNGSGKKPDVAPLKAPEAIPGARARGPIVPATHPAGDLQPTDALFDAINRGDIASARDALNRGADLNGVNVLGMTPMELSVDLGRNDISFLLLSMRGEDGGRGSRAVGRDSGGTPVLTAKTPAAKSSRPVKAASVAAPKPVPAPKQYARDGGTPMPTAGFLGFDSRSASN